ncbi:MAG: hypothetical protein JJU06_01470 [Ectothiorhodospiraceae bacterium]|nr:hypothetical protein [Ectothiorhodospiraceae bacterium]
MAVLTLVVLEAEVVIVIALLAGLGGFVAASFLIAIATGLVLGSMGQVGNLLGYMQSYRAIIQAIRFVLVLWVNRLAFSAAIG